MDDVEGSLVPLSVGDDTHSAQVTATSYHHDVAYIKLDEVADLARGNINPDSIIYFDLRVGVADGPAVMSHTVRDALSSHLHSLHLTQLELHKQ